MTPELTALIVTAGAWILLHLVVAGSPLRRVLVAEIREPGFQGMFSLLSLAGLVALVMAYRSAAAPGVNFDLWVPGLAALWTPLVVMPVALLLIVGSLTTPNPTSVGMERVLQAPTPARGILRITRHPLLWGFVLWAATHAAANGDVASLVLFAAIAVPALAGMFSIDRKRARRDPIGWQRYAAVTSIVPFAAIAAGRNSFVPGEIGLWRAGVALLIAAAIIAAHPLVIGASALPFS
ncbi:NnrU family protein [Nannocystis bainbridge]|uniref:NnrU family protein n=1 Tax=Nannocystis bainbridge TaxID=2995303 RepID=A0ABT5DU50_9BACT|nr:NnrU family protein [Nannocystis bainbridge]MDC0717081.1 NnrU family protein [Nannocystis bainbridge]